MLIKENENQKFSGARFEATSLWKTRTISEHWVSATLCAHRHWSNQFRESFSVGTRKQDANEPLRFSRSLGRAAREQHKKCRAHALGKKRDGACGRSNPLTQFQYSSSPKAAGSLNFRWGAFRNIQGQISENNLTSARRLQMFPKRMHTTWL